MEPWEERVWGAIIGYLSDYTITPMQTEIAEMLGISKQSVGEAVRRLQQKGYLRLVPGRHRNIEIITQKWTTKKTRLRKTRWKTQWGQ